MSNWAEWLIMNSLFMQKKNLKIWVLGYNHTATKTMYGCNMSQAQVRE